MNKSITAADILKRYSPQQLLAIRKDAKRILAERHLYEFLKQCWPYLDPAPFTDGFHLQAMCEHLEAVTRGEIKRLLINVPPRHCKSLLVSAAWPAWTWLQKYDPAFPLAGPQVKFMCLSYAATLALDHALNMRRLVNSPWYQDLWGDRVKLTDDQDAKEKFDTIVGGTRISGGVDGTITGRGSDIQILDDLHKVKEAESDQVREGVLTTYDRTLMNRVTNPKTSAKVIVMQRVHMQDLSGHVLEGDEGYVHLMLPAEFDSGRKCYTFLPGSDEPFWEDPRQEDGDLLWPEQWSPKELAPLKNDPYMWSGQYQQTPVPDGGGIIKQEWWQLWEGPLDANGKEQFPELEFVLASADTAYTEKQENDYSALTIWGLWRKNGVPKLILLNAWQKRLSLHGPSFDPRDIPGWDLMDAAERASIQRKNWGLVEWINHSCRRFRVDKLLIEAKASGISVAQEFRRLYRDAQFSVEMFNPKAQDKVARTHSIVPMFADGMIYAPDREYADLVIQQSTTFPRAAHDDLHDSMVQALSWFRNNNMIVRREEFTLADEEERQYKPKAKSLYPC